MIERVLPPGPVSPTPPLIRKCANQHYFLKTVCPHCGGPPMDTIERRDGDCIDCGQLCPGYAYGCTSPFPLEASDVVMPFADRVR